MKSGRVRKKEQPEPKDSAPQAKAVAAKESAPKTHSKPKRPSPSHKGIKAKKPKPPYLILGIMAAIFICFIIFVAIMTIKGGADEWVKATRVNGAWTSTVTIMGPQVQIEEMWQTDCVNLPNGSIRVGSCVLQDTKTFQNRVVDDYEEYAYNIYYEETVGRAYQAQGTEFNTASLSSDDWWEGDLHYTRQEELDRDSCEYTNYTIWIDDPKNTSQEVEVYLSECEVWDHIVVTERVYDQKSWCQCEVAALVEIGQQHEQGTGLDIHWANPIVPSGGQTQRAFKGQVTFLGDDYSYSLSTDDVSRYQDYLTSQYYIGLKDDKPVTVSKNPKD